MKQFLDYSFWGNTILQYLIATGVFFLSVILIRIVRSIIIRRLKPLAEKSETQLDDVLLHMVEKSILPILNIITVHFALHFITIQPKPAKIINAGLAVAMAFFVIRLVTSVLEELLEAWVKKQDPSGEKQKQMKGILLVIKLIVWLTGLVFLLDNLGYNVTAVVTGLGIGGVAIALASQAILGDLFNYFVIFFDRPFEIGDFIIVDDKNGIIEHVGVKTTRIKTLSGEQLVISNTDLTNSRIHNYKKMQRRRIVFRIRVSRETSRQQVAAIPGIIRSIIETTEGVTFDRSHFMDVGDYSFDFETVYYIESPDYPVYMDKHQSVLLRLFEEFETKGIRFASPTRRVYMEEECKPQF